MPRISKAAKLKLEKLARLRIKRLNNKFQKLPKAQKRVVLAEDVLKQIAAKLYTPLTGNGFLFLKKNYHKKSFFMSGAITTSPHAGKELQEVIMETGCTVCAIGGLFASDVRINDEYKVPEGNMQQPIGGSNTRTSVRRRLTKYFSPDQLSLIEAAFEGESVLGDISLPSKIETKVLKFRELVLQGKDARDKAVSGQIMMKAIMQNIIKNKGTFKP